MRALLLLLFVPIVYTTTAQAPAIGTGQFFQVGQTYHRDTYDIQPGTRAQLVAAGGANYAVDLGWVLNAPHYTTDSIVCTVAPGAYAYYTDYYDTANVMITITELGVNAISQYLFLGQPGNVQYVGGQPNGAFQTGDDLIFQRYTDDGFEQLLTDGMTFGTLWADSINARHLDASGSDDHFQIGTYTTVVDGYGSVTLPDGTVLLNTVRVRSVYDYMDFNFLFGDTQHNDTLYTWYTEDVSGPLMTLPIWHYSVTHGYVSPLPFALYRQDAVNAIIEPVGQELSFFPNPCTNALHLNNVHGAMPYTITDLLGKVAALGVVGVQPTIDTSTLPAGAYVLSLHGDRLAHGRFVVQR
jgi:hypothetical protein